MEGKNTTLAVVLVWRSGGDYDARDLENMVRRVRTHITVPYELIILSNEAIGDIHIPDERTKWWGKVGVFAITKRPCIYLDLDVALMNNIDSLVESIKEGEVRMHTPCSPQVERDGAYSSSIMTWWGDFSIVDKTFTGAHKSIHFDQTYITKTLLDAGHQIGMVGDNCKIVPWHSHARFGCDPDTQIINFFGEPRPRELGWPYWGEPCGVNA